MEKEPEFNLQSRQECALENGQVVSREFYDLVHAYRFPERGGKPTESEADALKSLEKEKKHFERAYYPGLAKDNLYQIISTDGRKLTATPNKPSELMVLAPQELRPKLEQAVAKRKELIQMINESLNDLSGWKELTFTHDAHPYLNETYAVIFAFLKEQGVHIKGAHILDVGYGSRLNAPQELAEQGAQSYAIDPNPHVPYGYTEAKGTKRDFAPI